MNDFWDNILRYPRFFISSFTGLILIILTPFKNFLKTSKSRLLLILFLLLFFLSLYYILRSMTNL
jgi:hypothetical protein|uniref:hypothetical protein n=1 Tax=Paralia sulcata TaxID=216927 RepID=UPI0022F317CA|nr:hypothetical protein PKF40_pgp017 [Paralia sulcata]WAJ57882.1 hypothetical protein [Paralia sulcata]